MINDLSTKGPASNRGLALTQELARIRGIGKSQRRLKMRNRRVSQVVTVLYLHSVMASNGVKDYAAQSLDAFVRRMTKNLHYYRGVDSVTSTFQFISRVVEAWYPLGENTAAAS